MAVNDLFLRQSLGTCRTDVVRIEYLEHIRSCVAHQGTDTHDRKRNDRKHHMLCHVKYFADAAVRLMHSSDDSVQVKPAEVD